MRNRLLLIGFLRVPYARAAVANEAKDQAAVAKQLLNAKVMLSEATLEATTRLNKKILGIVQ